VVSSSLSRPLSGSRILPRHGRPSAIPVPTASTGWSCIAQLLLLASSLSRRPVLLRAWGFLVSLQTFMTIHEAYINMASTNTAIVTGVAVPPAHAPTKRRRSSSSHSHVNRNGFSAPQPLAPIRSYMKKKYRHVAAAHSQDRASCLSGLQELDGDRP
jgi:hypothetical protein